MTDISPMSMPCTTTNPTTTTTTMPYNTRRKSLSLPSLGIQLPSTTRLHRSNSKPQTIEELTEQPSPKRVKREHDATSPLLSPRQSPAADLPVHKPQQRNVAVTPPPSPGDAIGCRKIDTDGINDDVVISVIEQLESTANRPHLIKELATILLTTNKSIKNSANPAALLSSRLTTYMKRPWTALSPCPIAKELIPVHPRKVFYYLTSQPRGELPSNSDDILPPVLADFKRLTPSISDPSVNEDAEIEHFERLRMSPSPEVELFSPELEHNSVPLPPTPVSTFSTPATNRPVNVHPARSRHNRAPSPCLEADEKGFTETASAVRAARLAQSSQPQSPAPEADDAIFEPKQQTDQEVRLELFGKSHGLLAVDQKLVAMSSPMIQPKESSTTTPSISDIEMGDSSLIIKSPETVDVNELDELFADYC